MPDARPRTCPVAGVPVGRETIVGTSIRGSTTAVYRPDPKQETSMPYLKQKAYALITEAVEDMLPLASKSQRLKDKIVFVDVGASNGIQAKWLKQKHNIVPVLFEPNPDEARRLREQLSEFERHFVLEHGLSDRAGEQNLHIGNHYGCTSILEANTDFLKDYAIADSYRTKKVVQINCVRYDDLVRSGEAPVPDVIKIDVEGYESFVLAGFGDLLHDVLAIETETFFYPVYKKQALLHDLIDQLEPFGLRLRRIEEIPAFDGDFICANAYFTKTKKACSGFSAERRAKHELASQVFRVTY